MCRTPQLAVHVDFDGARAADCIVHAPRRFSLTIHPERPAPINLSPWYAFRYRSHGNEPVIVKLRYSLGEHRYWPKLRRGGRWEPLPAASLTGGRDEMGAYTAVTLPPGQGVVAAQEILSGADMRRWNTAVLRRGAGRREVIGYSIEGRPIEALSFGAVDAARILLILGRQHPPEISGALALQAFVERLLENDTAMQAFRRTTRIVVVPLLNPDGVANGHWRTNRAGIDLNRDWLNASQPEVKAVIGHAARLQTAGRRRIALAIDFHSTQRNLFYVQGPNEITSPPGFTNRWLRDAQARLPDYAFAIEPRDAEPNSGTAKNHFHRHFGVPSITYEVGDDTPRTALSEAARVFASTLADHWLRQLP